MYGKVDCSESFTDKIWEGLVKRVSLFLHYDQRQEQELYQNSLYRLATAIPYLAGAATPLRYALQNLLTIIVMSEKDIGKDIFLHTYQDDENVFNRLLTLYHPEIGNEMVQKRALALLAIVMINDYCADLQNDAKEEKYNPVLVDIWNPEEKRQSLVSFVKETPCPDMDVFFTVEEALSTWFWVRT